jgi:hypothetical protein
MITPASTLVTRRRSALLAMCGTVLAVTIAGCGGSAYSSRSASRYGAPGETSVNGAEKKAADPSTERHTRPLHAAEQKSAPQGGENQAPAALSDIGWIPQNDGGDQDSDNNGGPSDGDGSV